MYEHKFVNAGFNSVVSVCKYCNEEQNERLGKSCQKHPDLPISVTIHAKAPLDSFVVNFTAFFDEQKKKMQEDLEKQFRIMEADLGK